MSVRFKITKSIPWHKDSKGVAFTEFREYNGTVEQVVDYFGVPDVKSLVKVVEGWGDECNVSRGVGSQLTFVWKLRLTETPFRTSRAVCISVPFTRSDEESFSNVPLGDHKTTDFVLSEVMMLPDYFEHGKNFYRYYYARNNDFKIAGRYNLEQIDKLGRLSLTQVGQTVRVEVEVTNELITVRHLHVGNSVDETVLFMTHKFVAE